MTVARERKVETRFTRRASSGKGVGLDEAVAAAEARIHGMREGARERIGQTLKDMQAARAAVAAHNADAYRFVRSQADSLVGLCGLFGLPLVGEAALSLCQLYDVCLPGRPSADGVHVHLDALWMFWILPADALDLTAPKVLDGLKQVVSAARHAPERTPGPAALGDA